MQSPSPSPLSYHPLEGDHLSPQGLPPRSPTALSPTHRRQRPSRSSAMPPTVKRSASTPNVRAQAVVDAMGLAYPSTDKRRNKLGYHRTSVACGHCRRRKIRCLLAPEDLDGRCSNCIRLKKECTFFPVDQQPPLPEKRPRPDPTTSDLSPRPPPTSPPLQHPSVVYGSSRPVGDQQQPDIMHQYPPIPLNPPHSNYPPPPDVRSRLASISTGKDPAPCLYRGYEYPRPLHPPPWENNGLMVQTPSSDSKSNLDDAAAGSFWRPSESPMTPVFSPFSGPPGFGHLPPRASGGSFSIEGGSEDIAWPMPGRSMSYGQLEGLPTGGYPSPYQIFPQDHQTPPNGPVYRSQLSTNASLAALSEPVSASTDGRPHAPWNPSTTYGAPPYSGVTSPASAGYAWYPEQGPLAQVKEEAHGTLSEEPPSYYSSAPQSTSSPSHTAGIFH